MTDLRQDINRVSSFRRCLNRTFPWRNCSVKTFYVNSNEKHMRRVTNTNLLFWVNLWLTKALMEYFLHGNISLRHMLNAKPPFMSWRRSAFNEVNDWALVYAHALYLYYCTLSSSSTRTIQTNTEKVSVLCQLITEICWAFFTRSTSAADHVKVLKNST